MNTAYSEHIINENEVLRVFTPDVHWCELKWHYDEEDRIVEVLSENDWKFQFDNKLPENMDLWKKIYIKKGVYHRVIKGNSSLVVKIGKIKGDI
jgi:hypothetical protein